MSAGLDDSRTQGEPTITPHTALGPLRPTTIVWSFTLACRSSFHQDQRKRKSAEKTGACVVVGGLEFELKIWGMMFLKGSSWSADLFAIAPLFAIQILSILRRPGFLSTVQVKGLEDRRCLTLLSRLYTHRRRL